MSKKDKLKKILGILQPDGTSVDLSEFRNSLDKLAAGLKEKIQAKTLDDVNNQLEKFRQKTDLSPLYEAMTNLESTLDVKINGLSGLLSEELDKLEKLQASSDDTAKQQSEVVASTIDSLRIEQGRLIAQKNIELAQIRNQLDSLTEFTKKSDKAYVSLQSDLFDLRLELKNDLAQDQTEDNKAIKAAVDKIDALRKELLNRINNIGGGAMNRQNYINNVDPLTRYTDINWKAGSNVTISYANNDQTKRVDITLSSSGGGGGSTRSINSISTSQTAGSTSGTDYVYLCSGTLTLTLPDATSNTNLYTVKNVGTGVVTINTTSAQTIDGNSSITMATQFTAVDLISDTANWNIT